MDEEYRYEVLDKFLNHLNSLPKKERELDMANEYTSREDEEIMDNSGTVTGAVYVNDHVNLKAAAAAARWSHEGPRKWAVLAGFEAIGVLIMLALASINPLFALVMLPVLAAGFAPQLITNHLLKTEKMIVLETYSGWGSQFQSELHRGFAQLERLTTEARDPSAPEEVKLAFAEIEPVLWSQALKFSALLKKLQQGGTKDLDSDTKRILREKLIEFKREVDKIDEVFKVVHSFSVLDIDTTVEKLQLETIVEYLSDGLASRKELASGSYDDTPVDSLVDDINNSTALSDGGAVDDLLATLKGNLEGAKKKKAVSVQKAASAA